LFMDLYNVGFLLVWLVLVPVRGLNLMLATWFKKVWSYDSSLNCTNAFSRINEFGYYPNDLLLFCCSIAGLD
jgi:hypothetical protein